MVPLYQQFLSSAVDKVSSDERFLGLLGAGSMITGDLDAYSDLDLILVYRSDAKEEVMSERTRIASTFAPLLASFTGEHVGEPRLIICLYGPPALHVDLKFSTPDELHTRIENPLILWEREGAVTPIIQLTEPVAQTLDLQWIEDRFWIWIHYGAAKLGRGELFECMDHIAFMRGTVLGPMLSTLRKEPVRGVRKLEFRVEQETLELLKSTVPAYSAKSCYDALEATILLYRQLRGRFEGIAIGSEAETVSAAYLKEIGASLKV